MDEGISGFSIKQRGCCSGGGNKCGRWNPTSEQVKVLMDLFRSGVRTPNTDQIQKISTQLSFYGKIESKNVFYWFQNHKARERQKRRKAYDTEPTNHDQIHCKHNNNIISSRKHFTEINQVSDAEIVIETLQLFPLKPVKESETRKLRSYASAASFIYACGREMDDDHNHPPLDLRLSFL